MAQVQPGPCPANALVDRRRSLGEDHTRMVSQLHQLLLELISGGANKDFSARRTKAPLGKVRPRQRKKAANKELTELVTATGTSLLDLPGIGPSGAARLLVEVGDITRFPNRQRRSWLRVGNCVDSGGKTHP